VRRAAALSLLAVLALVGCKASVEVGDVRETTEPDVAAIESVVMALGYEDDRAEDPTDVFPPDAEAIYAVVTLANPTDEDVEVRSDWIAVDAGGEKNRKIVETTETFKADTEGTIGFSLMMETEYPTGDYRVEIYLDDELADEAEFTVE
jgi:hypothetical protein